MVELTIPQEIERGFVEIRRLERKQAQELLSILEEEKPTLYRADLRKRVLDNVSTIPSADLRTIMSTLYSVYSLRDDLDLPIAGVVDAICDAMEDSDVEELHFSDEEQRTNFATRLTQLLSTDSLYITARASTLMVEHERTIHGKPRVLTDVRPVFGIDPEDPPKGATIVHTLRITYHENGVKEFYVALDTDDVDALVDVLGRASLKAETLKGMLAAAKVPHIDKD